MKEKDQHVEGPCVCGTNPASCGDLVSRHKLLAWLAFLSQTSMPDLRPMLVETNIDQRVLLVSSKVPKSLNLTAAICCHSSTVAQRGTLFVFCCLLELTPLRECHLPQPSSLPRYCYHVG
jgi:hypothetical protein